MKLAALCSQAVDYAKNGNPVEIHNNLPKLLIKSKPDWHKAEVTGARELDYYVSERALGHLFRNIELLDPEEPTEGLPAKAPKAIPPLKDLISQVLAPLVQRALNLDLDPDGAEPDSESENGLAEQVHEDYVREMRYICVTHTLVDAPDVRLKEGRSRAGYDSRELRPVTVALGQDIQDEIARRESRGRYPRADRSDGRDADGGAVSVWFVACVGSVGLGPASP